jgi:hypothetical protein
MMRGDEVEEDFSDEDGISGISEDVISGRLLS